MIRKAGIEDLQVATELALLLWPDGDKEERREEMRSLLENEKAAVFLAWEKSQPVGFAQCQLRFDYVEGCETSPVGYLEGVYAAPEYRGTGLAARLLNVCEGWSREQGCSEFASDCELENEMSRKFHMKNGFEEAGRIICFVKSL